MTDIKFNSIRPYQGTRHGGFEELCCQLARLETPSAIAFHRKGPGADAGVECFAVMLDGTETAWQTKYFMDGFGPSQVQQLDKSIDHALKKHPKMTRYIVCVPRNFRDPGADETELKRWLAWEKKWKAKAKKRNLIIERWDHYHLSGLLTKDDPHYAGRLAYWLDETRLTKQWFRDRFEKTRRVLGTRYTPETNVDIPLRKTLTYFSRDEAVRRQIEDWLFQLHRACKSLLSHQPFEKSQPTDPRGYQTVEKRVMCLRSALAEAIGEADTVPVARWQKLIEKCEASLTICRRWIRSIPQPEIKSHYHNTPADTAVHFSYEMTDLLGRIAAELRRADWKHINERRLLIDGKAGIGKSHLLADAAEHSLDRGQPALIIAGSSFDQGEPWQQILRYMDYPPSKQLKEFLGALESCAEAARTRAVIYIDAMNERHGTEIWPSHLEAFLYELNAFKRVAIVLSCRTTFLRDTIPETVAKTISTITHEGFKGHAAQAAQAYLNMRGISLASTPHLGEEFNTPLFLKTCCDYLEKENLKEFPKGLQGVNTIFKFYLDAIFAEMRRKMGLDPKLDIPRKALAVFIGLCLKEQSSYIDQSVVVEAFNEVLPSGGYAEKSLLLHFEQEGVLTTEPVPAEEGKFAVRFTFERMSDFEIANHLLNTHLDRANPKESFKSGTPLHKYLHDHESYNGGVIEAMAVLLVEQTSLELPDVMKGRYVHHSMRGAFYGSLLMRPQTRFTDATYKWIRKLFDEDEERSILISVATEPENLYNAKRLHDHLFQYSMPELDNTWTKFINFAGDENEGSIATLISWLRQGDLTNLKEDRAELAAIMVSWLLSSSNRYLRDQATKALSRLLQNRLHIAAELLKRFIAVKDLYILERVLGAIYGAVLQGMDSAKLGALAETVYQLVFASSEPPVNVLIRDYARGVIEYADWRQLRPSSVDIEKCRPPYRSAWVGEFPSDAVMETYKQTYNNGYVGRDAIVGSAVEDGDFARYVIDKVVDDWNPAPIGSGKPIKINEIFRQWQEDLLKTGTVQTLEAYKELRELTASFDGKRFYESSPEMAQIKAAEEKLRATLTNEEWGRYRTDAQTVVRYWSGKSSKRDHTANVDSLWARRWVCKRAHDLGWTTELFGEFDRNIREGGRHTHRFERIGKKYQWLAIYELAARLADNKLYVGHSWSDRVSDYEGPWSPHLRNIDVSLLVENTFYDGWKQWDPTWWVPARVDFSDLTPEEQIDWLDIPKDKVNDRTLIELTDPKTGKRWLAVDGYARWATKNIGDEDAPHSRDVWFRLDCRAVRKSDLPKIVKKLRGISLTNPATMRAPQFSGTYQFLGEYPWHPSLSEYEDEFSTPENAWGFSVQHLVTQYSCETGGYDNSMESTISLKLPSPWLMKLMKLRLSGGAALEYVDTNDSVIFFDPSVRLPGSSAGLVSRDAFLQALDMAGYTPIWVVAGEKGVHGRDHVHSSWGGLRLITRIHWLADGEFKSEEFIEPSYPSLEQLTEFLGRKPPSRFKTRKNEPVYPRGGAASLSADQLLELTTKLLDDSEFFPPDLVEPKPRSVMSGAKKRTATERSEAKPKKEPKRAPKSKPTIKTKPKEKSAKGGKTSRKAAKKSAQQVSKSAVPKSVTKSGSNLKKAIGKKQAPKKVKSRKSKR